MQASKRLSTKDGPGRSGSLLIAFLLYQGSKMGTENNVWHLQQALPEEPLDSSCEQGLVLSPPTVTSILVS